MTAPLVSVSGFLVSETVSTKQPTLFGAVALCSRGVASRLVTAPIPAGVRPTVEPACEPQPQARRVCVNRPAKALRRQTSTGELYAESCPYNRSRISTMCSTPTGEPAARSPC